MTDFKQYIDELASIVLKEGASDLHLVPGYRPTIRVSGLLVPLMKYEVLTPEQTHGLLYAMIHEEHQKLFETNLEVDFSWSYSDQARFRGNGYYSKGNVGVAMRFIPNKIKTLEELGLPETLRHFADMPQGFFLVVGPVGHGKSTTLASMVEIINQTRSDHIVTIEDPIEYLYTPERAMIDQREIRLDTKDFQTALTYALRQDVDVILIGEMRNAETMAAAVTAAETGHLVFSTLHTNNAAQTIDRIIDSFPANQQDQIRVQLAGSLLGVFSQRLIPRVSGGLIPAYELLINNNAVANLIRERRTHEINAVIETGLENGMVDMNRSLAGLVRAGEITVEDARKHSMNPKVLDKML